MVVAVCVAAGDEGEGARGVGVSARQVAAQQGLRQLPAQLPRGRDEGAARRAAEGALLRPRQGLRRRHRPVSGD